jgi:hypothetical protein
MSPRAPLGTAESAAAPSDIPITPARRLTVWLMLVTALLGVVAVVVDLRTSNASGGLDLNLPAYVVQTVLWLALARANRRATSHWPRILATILVGFYCLGTLSILADPSRFALSAGDTVVRVLTTATELAVVVLLLGEQRRWMRRLFRVGPP